MESSSERRLSRGEVEAVSARLAALADPTRIAMIEALRDGELSLHALADALDISSRNASHHVAVLHRAAILTRRREGTSNLYALDDWSASWLIHRTAESLQRED